MTTQQSEPAKTQSPLVLTPEQPLVLTPEQLRARKRRNIAIALAITAFAAFFYAITIAKLGVSVLNRPL